MRSIIQYSILKKVGILIFGYSFSVQFIHAQWILQTSNSIDNLLDVVMLDTIQAIAIGDRNAILRTNDAGVTWTNQTIAISAIYSWKNISFFDSPVLTLSSVDSVRNPKVKKELVKNKLGVGVRFHFGMTGERRLDEYFIKLKRKGIIVVSEPKTEFWGDRIFTVEDPDGYTLTFSEHVQDVSPEARVNAYELAHQEKIRV